MIEELIRSILVKLHILSPPEIRTVELLRKKGVIIGENVHIYGGGIDSNYGGCIKIGDNVSLSYAKVLAHDASTKKVFGYTKIGRVYIGNNVFVGYGAIILPETFIEDNVIIGAGSVVRGKIEGNSVIVGNPAVRVCSYDEYMEKNRKSFENGYICDGDFTLEVIAMMDEKRVFVK